MNIHKTTIVIALILAMVFILFAFMFDVVENESVVSVNNVECEHEFVITSKYNWFRQSYRTFSKCHKCGLEV